MSMSLPSCPPARCGFALLFALAALILVLAAVGSALAALHATRSEIVVAQTDERLLSGLRAGEQLALSWIAANAERLVLPPDGGGVVVAHDRWSLPHGAGALAVVIYDGLAGIPAPLAQSGSPLRFALPDNATSVIIPAGGTAARSADLLERLDLPAGLPRFPHPFPGIAREWSLPGAPAAPMPLTLPDPPKPSLAELISFHSDGRINLNTAPAPLLRVAYQQLGLGDIEGLLERRQQGSFTALPETADPAKSPQLVSTSDVWQALVTATWEGAERHWWVVITGNRRELRIVQRHDADR
jgi:hypothetical protein